jgi:hypothetical protein
MAFPLSPIDGQLYTNALGTQYQYVLADTAWKIVNGGGGGTVKGSGTAGYLAKFTDTTTVGNSVFNTTGTQTTILSTIHDPVSDGSNIFMGGGGQSLSAGATYESSNNAAFGIDALKANTSGLKNTAVGKDTLKANTTGYVNTAVGHEALLLNEAGYSNVAVGSSALHDNSGNNNTVVGASAMYWNQTGQFNVAVGNACASTQVGGALTDPLYCTYVGYGVKSGSVAPDNEIVIGAYDGVTAGKGSNSTSIGNCDTTQAVIYGDLVVGKDSTNISDGVLRVARPLTDAMDSIRFSVGGRGNGWTEDTANPNIFISGKGTLAHDGTCVIMPPHVAAGNENRCWMGRLTIWVWGDHGTSASISHDWFDFDAWTNDTTSSTQNIYDISPTSPFSLVDDDGDICVLITQATTTQSASCYLINRNFEPYKISYTFDGCLSIP